MDTKQSREALKAIREEITMALVAVTDNNPGLKLTLERCTFDYSGGFSFKLSGNLPGGKSKEETAYEGLRQALAIPEQTYELNHRRGEPGQPFHVKGPIKPGIELPPLGAKFEWARAVQTVVGATRTKVMARDDKGKVYLWKPEAVAKLSQQWAGRNS